MKRSYILSIMVIIFIHDSYAQNRIFDVQSYYSKPDEITVEIRNKSDYEAVLLIDRGSLVSFYRDEKQNRPEKMVTNLLLATDSFNILARIPMHKIYVAKYKMADAYYDKLHLEMRYTLDFISPPASTKWEKYEQAINISPYNSLRKTDNAHLYYDKREKMSGEYVYSNPEVMPEFPGGEKALREYLEKEAYDYSYDSGEMSYVRTRVVIEKDGTISHPYLILGEHPYFQNAALEIIKRMPKWNPGLHKGKPVRTYYTIPILFRIVDRIY